MDHIYLPLFLQGIIQHFVPQVISDNSAYVSARLPPQHPAPLISLYNAVVEHLANVASSNTLMTLDWPIPEFASEKLINGDGKTRRMISIFILSSHELSGIHYSRACNYNILV